MFTKNHGSLIRKALCGIFLLGVFLSAFSAGNLPSVRAQEGTPGTPAPDTEGKPEFLPEGANCSTPTVLDDQWSSGFRLVCQNNFYVLLVDLTNPAIKVEVKAASTGTQTVSSFADSNTIAIINADYQWCSSGAICSQGLTIENGSNPTTFTNISHLCSDAKVRREIGFSQDGRVVVDWWYRFVSDSQARAWCGSIPGSGGGLEQYNYNLVGGGPQFTFDGTFHWDCQYGQNPTTHDCLASGGDVGINGEHFALGSWWNRYQSAIGYSTDGTVLALGESNNQTHTMQDVHDIMYQRMSTYGKTLKNAFKFDGGSKAGFWYYNHSYDSTPLVLVPNVIRIQRTNSTCYSLSTNVNPGGAGNINVNTSSNCAQGKYLPGTNVQISANTNSGYSFDNWSGSISGSNNPVTITMDSNKNVTANFSLIQPCYGLTLTHTGTGSDPSPTPGNSSGCPGGQYHAGEGISLSASPSGGWVVGSWNGTNNNGSTSTSNTATMPAGNHTVTVNYIEAPFVDLLPYPRAGRQDPVIASSVAGTTVNDTLYAGQPVYFDWGFKNIGNTAVNTNFYVDLFIDGQILTHYPFAALGAGALSGFDDWMETWNQPGWHTVKLSVDPGNTVVESDETNNIWTKQFYWEPTLPAAPSNLTVSGTTTSSITLSWQDNSNNESGFNIYRYYIGGGPDFYLYAQVGPNVTTYTNTQLPCGSEYFYKISAYNAQGESSQSSIVRGVSSACFDLSITNISFSPVAPYSNENTWVVVDTQNLGTGDAGAFWIDIYINRQPTGCADWGDYWIRVDALAANATIQKWIEIPAGSLPAGSYQVRAFVDSGCEFLETNENNNVAGPAALTIATPPPAPAHDDFDAAKTISPIPYSDVVDVTGATKATDDPSVTVNACNLAPGLASVWYKYTPSANIRLSLDTFNSDYDTYIAVWTGSRGSLTPVGCNNDSNDLQSALELDLNAGTTYFVEVAQYNGPIALAAPAVGSTREISTVSLPGSDPKAGKSMTGEAAAQTVRTLNFHVAYVTPKPLSPTGTLTTWDNIFTWTGLASSQYYHLEVSSAPEGSPIIVDNWYPASICSGLNCTASPPASADLPNGDYKWRVQDYSATGYGAWSAYMYFTLNRPTITLISPSGTLTSWDNTIRWTGTTGSIYYHLEVSPAPDGSPLKVDDWYPASICSGVNCTVSPLASAALPNGDYKWRVQDYSSTGYSAWTGYMYFTLNLPTITLISPTGTLTTWDNTFRWTGTSSSQYYHLEVSSAPEGSPLKVDDWYPASICSGVNCTVSPLASAALPNGDYKWRVQDYSSTGYGAWTAYMYFTLNLPTIKLIAPTGTLTTWPTSFSWTGTASSSYYHLEVSPVAGGNPVIDRWYPTGDICTGLNCTALPPELASLAAGDYKWHIQDYSSSGYGAWTADTNFSMPIKLVAPAGTLTSWANIFHWTGMTRSSYYHLEVSAAAGGTPIFEQWYPTGTICIGLDCTVSPLALTSLADGDYQWRVQDYSPSGYGDWTPYTSFTLSRPTITLISPSGILTSWDNTFNWTGTASSSYYHLEVSEAPAGSPPIVDYWFPAAICSGLNCTVSYSQGLPNGAYKWRVQDYSSTGYGAWTDYMYFTLNLPTITLNSPSGTLTSWPNTFSWTGLASSLYYHLEVYQAAGSTPIFDQWYPAGTCSGLSCAVSPPALAALSNGAYKWRIQDYSTTGYGSWTADMNFTLNR